jgi:hypothetical protein
MLIYENASYEYMERVISEIWTALVQAKTYYQGRLWAVERGAWDYKQFAANFYPRLSLPTWPVRVRNVSKARTSVIIEP